MKVAFVIPRYGSVGGAEHAVSALAMRLAKESTWEVDLHTTCARSSTTWANEEGSGSTTAGSLKIPRYPVDSGRSAAWGPLEQRIKLGPSSISRDIQEQFFYHQGPVSFTLKEAIKESQADLIFFAPYLFWPTMAAAPEVSDRAVIIPAAHDEPYLRLSMVKELLESSRGLLFGSAAEQKLLYQHHDLAHLPSTVLGWGTETPMAKDSTITESFGLRERPYVMCLGRIEHAKGTHGLIDFWRNFKQRNPCEHQLVLVGDPSTEIPNDSDIQIIRTADDRAKWALLRDADFLINPSAMESFSLVLFEAWAAGIPVLVNGYCNATKGHVEDSLGGLWYRNYPEFEVAVQRLMSDKEFREKCADNGMRFGEAKYSWQRITARFKDFCKHLV